MKTFALRVPVLLLLLPALLPLVLTPHYEVNPGGASATLDAEADEDGGEVTLCATVDGQGQVDAAECVQVRFCVFLGFDYENGELCPNIETD